MAEDYDLSFRVEKKGLSITYEPECEMIHDHGFDPQYDVNRFDHKRESLAHIVLWEKHQRLLLPPSALRFYRFLIRHGMPSWTLHEGAFTIS